MDVHCTISPFVVHGNTAAPGNVKTVAVLYGTTSNIECPFVIHYHAVTHDAILLFKLLFRVCKSGKLSSYISFKLRLLFG
jgi:hypothetical protein